MTPGLPVAPACSSAMHVMPGSNLVVAFDPFQGVNVPSALACLPAEVTLSWRQGSSGSTRTSLGPFHCPSAFTTATSTALNSISTSVFCCPSNYVYTKSGTSQQCMSTLTSGSIVPKSILAPSAVSTSWIDATITTVPTTVRGAAVEGYIFADSTTTFKSTTSKLKTSTKSTKKTSPTSASSKTSSGKKRKKKGSLGTGGLAGIIVGAVLVVALIVLFVVIQRRKKRKGAGEETEVVEDKRVDGGSGSEEMPSREKRPAIDHTPLVVGENGQVDHGSRWRDGEHVQHAAKGST